MSPKNPTIFCKARLLVTSLIFTPKISMLRYFPNLLCRLPNSQSFYQILFHQNPASGLWESITRYTRFAKLKSGRSLFARSADN